MHRCAPSISHAEAEKQAQRLINNLERRQIANALGDDALYKAKANCRNQLAWATEEE